MNKMKSTERIIRDIACKFLIKLQSLIFSRSYGVKPPFQQKVFKSFNRLIRWTIGEEEYALALARGIEKIKSECTEIS